MRAGEVVEVDFGLPIGSEAGFRRPAVVVTADFVLDGGPRTIHVVPVTSNLARSLSTEVEVTSPTLDRGSAAQCHLCTAISTERIVGQPGGDVGAASLAEIRSVLADLLDVP